MGRPEELPQTSIAGINSSGWKATTSEAQEASSAQERRPASIRTWANNPTPPELIKAIGRSAARGKSKHRVRSARPRGELNQQVARYEVENEELRRRVTTLEREVDDLKKGLLEYGGLAPLMRLVEAGRIIEARQLLSLLLEASPTPKLKQWAELIALPVVRAGGPAAGSGIEETHAWLRQHAGEYAGKWVALREGVLLGADESRVALHRRLEQSGELEGAIFARL